MTASQKCFGLHDPLVLAEACDLVPDLFLALRLAQLLSDKLPLRTESDALEAYKLVNAALADTEILVPPPESAIHSFPAEYYPVSDVYDLIRKLYLAITARHLRTSIANSRMLAATGRDGVQSSHPMPSGDDFYGW